MPAPSPAVFKRLSQLVAIDPAAKRKTRPIVEAFSGTELSHIPIGTAKDLEVAVAAARVAQQGWAARTPRSGRRSCTPSRGWFIATPMR